MPAVTEPASPYGLPIATTGSPTRTSFDRASASGSSSSASTSTSITARSVEGSVPTMVASVFLPSAKVTETSDAPETTCAFVTM